MSGRAELATRGAASGDLDVLVPHRYRVVERRVETAESTTLFLDPIDAPIARSRPGQFNMLTAFGRGEAAISISGDDGSNRLAHTVRNVGPVSGGLAGSETGAIIGVRGPFGTPWPIEEHPGEDVVVIGGGIGLAPLRGVIDTLLDGGSDARLFVLIGARSPAELLYADEYQDWERRGAHVAVSVDAAGRDWKGRVGLVTTLVPDAAFDPARTIAMVCGPEIMMRFVARALIDRGVAASHVAVSLERNMQCGVGLCGHCQLGPLLLCRDGAVVSYGDVALLMEQRQR